MATKRGVTRYVMVSSENEAVALQELTKDMWSQVYDPLDCKMILGFDCGMWAVRYHTYKEDFDAVIEALRLKRYRRISDSRVYVYGG